MAVWLEVTCWLYDQQVTLHQTRLILGWVTVCRQVHHLGMEPATQVNSAFYPLRVGKLSNAYAGWG